MGADVRGRYTLTTHSSPYRASGARFAVRARLQVYVLGGWAGYWYYPSPVPTRSHTHCRYTPLPHHPKVGNLGVNTRFGTLVGEPRGIEHTLNIDLRDPLYALRSIFKVYTAV